MNRWPHCPSRSRGRPSPRWTASWPPCSNRPPSSRRQQKRPASRGAFLFIGSNDRRRGSSQLLVHSRGVSVRHNLHAEPVQLGARLRGLGGLWMALDEQTQLGDAPVLPVD